jgi:chorismate dehydratase
MIDLKISVISYLNTVPFVYGIQHSGYLEHYQMEFDVPSTCATKLIHNQTDVGIVPVATIPLIPNAEIITDYCIGAIGPVRTVILASDQPIEDIKKVYLDAHSRTSVKLVKVLDRFYWKQNFEYFPLPENHQFKLAKGEAAVLIGDKTFGLEKKFKFIYDLSATWFDFTGLPFVFAVWVANKKLDDDLQYRFIRSLEYGINHRNDAAASVIKTQYPDVDIEDYLLNVISYNLDSSKLEGMNMFLKMINEKN